MGGNPSFTSPTKANEKSISDIQQEQAKRRVSNPAFANQLIEKSRLEEEALRDPSLSGKAARFVGSGAVAAAPAIVSGVLSGGSIPVVAGTAALQSASQPENLALNVGLSVAPVPSVAPLLKRIRGGRSPKTPMTDVTIPKTQPIPQLQGPGRPTAKLPSLAAEDAPTLGLSDVTETLRLRSKGPKASFDAELESVSMESLITRAERTPVLETISALRKAGLLTGLKTHIKNVGGTGLFQLSEEASRVPGAIVDMVMSLKTGRRTLSGPSLQAMGRSAYESATRGRNEAWDIIKSGVKADDNLPNSESLRK